MTGRGAFFAVGVGGRVYLRGMKNFFTSFFATLTALIVFLIGGFLLGFLMLGVLIAMGQKKPVAVQEGSYLVFDLSANMTGTAQSAAGVMVVTNNSGFGSLVQQGVTVQANLNLGAP